MTVAIDTPTITSMIAGVTPLVNLGAQWIKQHPWFKNNWIIPLAPLVGLGIALGGLITSGMFDPVTLHGDWFGIWNNLLGGLAGGIGSLVTYDVQKQVGQKLGVSLLPPGPNNHSSDAAHAVQQAIPVVEEVLAKQ